MQDPLSWVPIRYKLSAAFIIICVMAFGVGGFLVSRTARRTLEHEIAERLKWQALAEARSLGSALEILGRRTQDFASDGFIREAMREIVSNSSSRSSARARVDLIDHIRRNKLPLERAFADVMIYDSFGTRVAAVRSRVPEREEEFVRGVLAAEDLRFGPITPAESPGGEATFAIATPLWDIDRTERLGTMVTSVRIPGWIQIAFRPGDATAKGMTVVLEDGSGGMLLVEDAGATGEDGVPRIRIAPVVSPDEPGRFSFSERIPLNGWRLRVDMDATEALEPVSGLQSRFLAAILLILATAMVLLYFPMRFLVQPLGVMQNAARRITEGDLSARVDIRSQDEIGDLARSFNLMATAVEEHTRQLESTAADLKARQEELSVERDRLKTIVHAIDDGLILLNEDGEIEMANAQAAPIVRLLQNSDPRVTAHRCVKKENDHCVECIRDPASGTNSCMIDVEGATFELLATTLGVTSSRRGRVIVSRDVTEYVTMDEKKAHQDRLAVLGEVSAVIAHELNNPLAAISMYNQMMEKGLGRNSEWSEHIDVIRRNTEICKRSIRGLLDFAAGASPEVSQFDLWDVLEEVRRFLAPILERSRAKLEIRRSGGAAEMEGVETHVRQVFVNLVMNAAQAMAGRASTADGGGRITIAMDVSEDRITCDVSDEGPGVPEAIRDRIFEPFFTTKPPGIGTGLGLSTSRRIIDSVGGELLLHATGPAGSVFRVVLPRRAEPLSWRNLPAIMMSRPEEAES